MAQVEMTCGPYRIVSLISREAADDLALEPGSLAWATRQVHQRLDRRQRRENVGRAARPGSRALTLAGCGSDGSAGRGGRPCAVLAAASLTEPFTALEKTYEKAHPGVDVELSFDSSAILVEQLSQGLAADVLATADQRSMDKAVAADVIAGARAVRDQHARHRDPRGQPGRHHGHRRPRRRDLRRLRAGRAVRRRHAAPVRARPVHRQAGHRGGERQGRAHQGHGRRGRRRPGLRLRREGRRRQGRRRPGRERVRGRQRRPDRRGEGQQERRRREGLDRPRHRHRTGQEVLASHGFGPRP